MHIKLQEAQIPSIKSNCYYPNSNTMPSYLPHIPSAILFRFRGRLSFGKSVFRLFILFCYSDFSFSTEFCFSLPLPAIVFLTVLTITLERFVASPF